MSTIYQKTKEALDILSEICYLQSYCLECPFYRGERHGGCLFDVPPVSWKEGKDFYLKRLLEEEDNDE